MDYKVVSAFSSSELADNVRESILEGWRPYGNLNVISFPDKGALFIQAMIKDPLPDRDMRELIYWIKKQNEILENIHRII